VVSAGLMPKTKKYKKTDKWRGVWLGTDKEQKMKECRKEWAKGDCRIRDGEGRS